MAEIIYPNLSDATAAVTKLHGALLYGKVLRASVVTLPAGSRGAAGAAAAAAGGGAGVVPSKPVVDLTPKYSIAPSLPSGAPSTASVSSSSSTQPTSAGYPDATSSESSSTVPSSSSSSTVVPALLSPPSSLLHHHHQQHQHHPTMPSISREWYLTALDQACCDSPSGLNVRWHKGTSPPPPLHPLIALAREQPLYIPDVEFALSLTQTIINRLTLTLGPIYEPLNQPVKFATAATASAKATAAEAANATARLLLHDTRAVKVSASDAAATAPFAAPTTAAATAATTAAAQVSRIILPSVQASERLVEADDAGDDGEEGEQEALDEGVATTATTAGVGQGGMNHRKRNNKRNRKNNNSGGGNRSENTNLGNKQQQNKPEDQRKILVVKRQ